MDLFLSDVRLSFPKIYRPEKFNDAAKVARYSAALVIEPGSENDKLIREAFTKELEAAFGTQAARLRKEWEFNRNKWCYQESNREDTPGMILACHTQTRPSLFSRRKEKLEPAEAEAENVFYPGCRVNAKVSIYAQKSARDPSMNGIRASFSGLQFFRHDEAFSGGRPASADEFPDLGDDSSEAEDFC